MASEERCCKSVNRGQGRGRGGRERGSGCQRLARVGDKIEQGAREKKRETKESGVEKASVASTLVSNEVATFAGEICSRRKKGVALNT